MNPGFDLLLAANWSSVPAYQEIALPSPQALVGLSQFAAVAASNPPGRNPSPGVSVVATATASASVGQGRLVRNLVVVSAGGVLLLALATLLLKHR